jgi:hypothetical protein
MNDWIKVTDRLPEEGKSVLGWVKGRTHPVRLKKGLSKKTRQAMLDGDIPMEYNECFMGHGGVLKSKRTSIFSFYDEEGNNKRAYGWDGEGPFQFFGQDVTHWMELPEPPEE